MDFEIGEEGSVVLDYPVWPKGGLITASLIKPKPIMSEFKIDLSKCDREPIHIPDQIQSNDIFVLLNRNHQVSYVEDMDIIWQKLMSNYITIVYI